MNNIKFDELSEKKRRQKLPVLFLFLVLICLPLFFEAEQMPLPDCYFKNLTGIDCPSCGITRGYFSAGNWHFAEAAHFHLFSLIGYWTICLIFIFLLFEIILKKQIILLPVKNKLVQRTLLFFLSLFMLHWLIKILI